MAMKIREEAFCTNGTGYDCELVLKRDKTLILREAKKHRVNGGITVHIEWEE